MGLQKRRQRSLLISPEWRLAKESSGDNVLHVLETCGSLTPRGPTITTKNDTVDILGKIQAKDYTPEEVTMAFCKRAAIAQQAVSTHCKSPAPGHFRF